MLGRPALPAAEYSGSRHCHAALHQLHPRGCFPYCVTGTSPCHSSMHQGDTAMHSLQSMQSTGTARCTQHEGYQGNVRCHCMLPHGCSIHQQFIDVHARLRPLPPPPSLPRPPPSSRWTETAPAAGRVKPKLSVVATKTWGVRDQQGVLEEGPARCRGN